MKHDATMQKLTAADPETHSPDLVAENLAALQALFPELITEGPDGVAVNIDVLKALVGDKTVSDADEKYGLNWHGKRRARQLALTPSTGTLRPCPEDSVDWDTTQNLMIEGDNLEVLKLLQKSYAGKVKLIYIDPPYNTGKDFVYPDNFQDNIKNYLELTGQRGEGGRKLSSNTEASGRFHTEWLNMMYPRLIIARTLLISTGVIFISIGEDEVDNLCKVCDEIFGGENRVARLTRIAKRTSDKGTHFRPTKDYILVYAKDIQVLPEFGIPKERDEKDYKYIDGSGRAYKKSGASLYQPSLDTRPNQRYYIEAPDGSLIIPPGDVFPSEQRDGDKVKPKSNADKVWRWSVESYLKQKHLLIFTEASDRNPLLDENGNQSKWNIYPKVYFDEDVESALHPEDVVYDYPNSQGTKEINTLDIPFSFAKPVGLIQFLIKLNRTRDVLVMDFFAGSATTAHAVMKLNADDGGSRKFIMIQLPEACEEETEAAQAGYKNIAELTKARLRRAGKKIKEENSLFAGDLGFRVFKLDSTNILEWDPDRDKIAETLEASIEHLKTDRTEQDILFELLLKLGLDLCVPIETQKMEGSSKQFHDIHSIGGGSLLVCLSQSVPQVDVEPLALALVAWHQELNPAGDTTVVFRDSAFADDVAKSNITAILQQHGLETVRSL